MAIAKIRSFISGFFGRSRFEKSMSEEIEFHIESRTEDLVARGTPFNEARRRARLEFGSAEKYRDEMRRARGLRWLDELRDDLSYGYRRLRHNWRFGAVATISLALGIGVNTLVFSIVNSTLLKPMRYADPDRLVVIWTTPAQNPQQTGTSSVSTYFGLKDQSQSFESVGAFNGGGCGVKTLGGDRDGAPAERLFGQCFSPSLFTVLGIKPFMGRVFTDSEDQVGNVAPVVLISHGLWQRRFGSDSQIVGKTIDFNLTPTTVIGVLPADFELFKDPNADGTRGTDIDFVVPLELTPTQVQSKVGGLTIVGRLKPGLSINQAAAEIETIASRLASTDPERHEGLGARVDALDRAAYRDYRGPLLLLEGAVAFVLLISCANVAGLLLARMASRRTEIALRTALGASRTRIVRQLITENLPVAFLGGVGAIVLSTLGLNVLIDTAPSDFPHLDQISLDARVLGFTALVIVLTSILSSVVPAMQASKINLGDPLKESVRSTGGSRQQRLRSLLVMGQIALALILLVCSGLMVRSFVGVLQTDFGAEPANLLTFDFRMTQGETVTPAGRYRGLGLWNISTGPAKRVERVLDRLQSVPGVQGVAAVNTAPFRTQTISMPFVVEGKPAPADRQQQLANYFAVTRGFFKVMRTRILRGRDFDEHDNAESPHVMIINETMARQFWSSEDPIGKHVTLDWVPNERPWEIVGVVQDSASPLQRQQAPAVYVPHLQQPSQFTGPGWYMRSGMYFVIRTAVEPTTLLVGVKAAVAEVDRSTPVAEVRTARQTILNQVRNLRLYMLLLGVFGIVATVLAATGLYSVMAYSVAERTREIGIRIALGGRLQDILMMVFRYGIRVIAIGLAAGLVSSLAITRLLRSSVFGITVTDPVTYVGVSLLVFLVGVVACLIPARRAASVDPTVALKYE